MSSYATDGTYTIQCRFEESGRHARITSVTTDGCNFTVRAGNTQGSATLSVLYNSSGGDETTGVITLNIGPSSVILFNVPAASSLPVVAGGAAATVNAGSYVSDGSYTISCGDATSVSATISVQRTGCSFAVTAQASASGTVSFAVPYTSDGGNARSGTIRMAVSKISYAAPVGLSVASQGIFVLDASDYASDGSFTISCGTATIPSFTERARITSITRTGCSYEIRAANATGSVDIRVPYTSTGGATSTGTVRVSVGDILALSSTDCSNGTFVNTTDNPRVSGADNDLVEDCEALVAMYQNWRSTAANSNLRSSYFVRTWGAGTASQRLIENWEGVTVSSGRVTGLDLENFGEEDGVSGTIHSTIGDLGALTSLNIAGHQLSGSIPSEVYSLTSLTELDLSENSLSGTLSTSLGSLTALTNLILSGNSISGGIPTQISSLTALTALDLGSNSLTGRIPTGIASLTALTQLDLSSNSLEGSIPTQLGSLTALTSLLLSGNSFTGSIPTQLGSLTALTLLSLNNNSLTGSIPTQLGSLTNLVALYINNNRLQGSVPSQLGTLTTANSGKLAALGICANELTGALPTALRTGVMLVGYPVGDGFNPIACQRDPSNVVFTAPTGLAIGRNFTLAINASEHVSEHASYTVSCADATGVDATKMTVTRSSTGDGCTFTVDPVDTLTPANQGDATFSVLFTSTGGDTATGTFTVNIGPDSSITYTAPANLFVVASGTLVIDAAAHAADGSYTITCGDATGISSTRFSSVVRSAAGNGCSFTVTATASTGDGNFTVPFTSSGGSTANGQFTVSVTTISYNAPTGLSVAAGRGIAIGVSGYVSDGANTITCSDATSQDITDGHITVSRNGCTFTITAGASAAGENVVVTVPVTSSGGGSRTVDIAIAITAASSIVFTDPSGGVNIGAGNSKTIDVGSFATDGTYTIQCRFNESSRHTRIVSVTTDGCNFTVRAGTSQGSATLSVLYNSSGGDETTGVVSLNIGPSSALLFTAPSASSLSVAAGGSATTVDASSYVTDGSYTISCGDATSVSATISVQRTGCSFAVTAQAAASGIVSFTVPYTSDGGNSRSGTIRMTVSKIAYAGPTGFSMAAQGVLEFDASDYASDGDFTITCGAATIPETAEQARITSITRSGCDYTVRSASGASGAVNIQVPYTSSGGATRSVLIRVDVGAISALSSTDCSNGTYIDIAANPRVSGADNDLVEDCEALVAMHENWRATTANSNLRSSYFLRTWGTGTASERMFENWEGITVTGGRVTGLDLENLGEEDGISGTIHTTIGDLGALTSLNLAGHQLSGSIPSELWTLTSLTVLDLGDNSLSGTLSTSLGSLTSLTSLLLGDNSFTGGIPTQISSLTALTNLDLSGNSLSGGIPTQLSSLTALASLDLSENSLTGEIPTQLFSLTSLTSLLLGDNDLTGEIPTGLSSLTALTLLDLSSNGFTGEIPTQLSSLVNLLGLYLNDNRLQGSVPSQLTTLLPAPAGSGKLTALGICDNELTGALPTALRTGISLLGYPTADGYSPIACQRAPSKIVFTAPTNLKVGRNRTLRFSAADHFTEDSAYRVTCGDATGIDSTKITSIARSSTGDGACTFTVDPIDTLTPAQQGDITFSVLFTSSGGDTATGTFTVNIGPDSDIVVTRVMGKLIAPNKPYLFNAAAQATDGDYAITCSGIQTGTWSTNFTATRIGGAGSCLYLITAIGGSGVTSGIHFFYNSEGGDATSGQHQFEIGADSAITFTPPAEGTFVLDTNSSQLTVNAATYASDGSYTISCADVASSSVWVDRLGTSAAALISSISRTGCSYTITSAAGQSTLGAISFPVHYTSSGGGVIQGVIPITVRQKSDISFRAPTLSLPAGRTLVIDAGRYASDGAYSITCGTATSVNANLTVSNTGCSYAITAGGTLGAATFTVPYTSSGSDTHNGVVSITVTSTYPGAIIPLDAAGCTDGTFVNLTTDPRVSGNNNDLVEDCQALVAMQNHWAAIEENHSLGETHKLRLWGTGTATQKMVENWSGITVNKDYTFGSRLATAPRRVTELDLGNGAGAGAFARINGNIPAEIGNLNRLVELDLTRNNLSGPIIAELANLRYLQRWKMGHNKLSGSIPSEISVFNQTPSDAPDGLRDIEFNNNQLSGSIPYAFTRLSTVGEFDLSNNKLSGAIPSALRTMANLSEMRLSNNRLTGAIPATWWAQTYVFTGSDGTQRTISVDFEALRRLYLDGNLLSGSIPSGLKLLSVLGTVHLANNQFTGSIPSNFDFGSLAICGNYLTGAVPAGQQFGGGGSLINYPRSEGYDPVACQRSGTPDLPAISAYPLIPKLAASDCSGRFLPADAPAMAVSDCEILVTAQNLWADEAANRNLPDDHFLRTWGRGSTVEIGNWEGVTFSDWRVTGLSLASKNLRGSVHSQLGDLSAMTSLDISSNLLSGSLPGELDRLTAAGSLTSANVLLTGSLTSFDFCSNHLSGSISATLVAQDSGVTFGAAAEAVRTQLIADQMMVCQRTGSVPAAAERQLGFTYAKALAGGATVQGLHAGLGLEPDAVISRWNTTTSAWVAITCSQRDAANECTGAWTPATLAADTVVRYEDGYADSATLTPLKLERVASPEPVAAVSVSFSTPATFALQGGNTLVIDARNYIADAGLGITCADATSVGTKLNSVTRSGCVYTVVAKTGSANEGAASFTIPFTPTGRSAQNGVVSVTVTPASDLAISQPSALAVRAGVSTTIDVASLVTDGDYAITCRDATQMHSRITTVSRTAGSCSFAITAGASRAAVTRGDATITVPFASTGGGLTSFQIQLEVSKIAYTAPTDLRIEAASKTLEIDASEFAADGDYTFTCSDASSLTGNLATVAHTGDSCTFTATTTSSTATGAASFTTTYTSSGGDVLEAVIPVTVGPARNIVFTAPTALAIGAGGTLVFDVSSYATDGDFWEITCGDSTAKTSRIASVTRVGDTCEFRVRAGSEEGTASFTVPYISENGATISGVVPVVVGTAASIVFAPPAASFPTGLNVEASKSIVIDASAYATDGSYTISCGDATNNSALWQSVVRDSGGNGCSFTATARAGVSGPASFTVPYSSSGGGSLNGRISVFIRPLSDIVFTAPPTTGRFSLTVLSGRVLVLDVAGYAADGDYEISCTSAAAAADAGITVENSGCSVAITGGMTGGSASFTVGYMSSGGDTHTGTVALSVSRAVSGTAIPLLSNAGCTDGTFVNLTTNPRVTGANNDLAEDCMALVAIQNHFAGFEANRDLGEFHAFREWGDASTEWGTGTASDRLVQNWLDITVTGGRVTDWHIGVQAGVVFGTLPSEFQNLTALERLDFDDHKLSGNLPSWLGSMSALDDVDLSGNNFSGPIPSELGNLSSLQFLNLAQNELSGSIPSQLGSLSNLVRLYLDRNQLSGSIPSQLGSLSSTAFRQLNLSDNRLSGSIPSQLTSLTALRNLILNNNLLTGGIPSGIGSLTSLITLDLNSNRLSGSIPTGISSLTNLFRLNLSNNQITGAIPAAVGNLVTLNAAGNRFTGYRWCISAGTTSPGRCRQACSRPPATNMCCRTIPSPKASTP